MADILRPPADTATPFIPTESFFATKRDDIGRPTVQHKAFAKGEYTQPSLAKVFDDPGMRPKVFVPQTVNKTSYSLMSRDIEGAVSKPKDIPARPRDTNPMAPSYILPGSSALANSAYTTTAQSASAAAFAAASPYRRSADAVAPRDTTLNVADILAVDSVVERPSKLATRDTALNTADIEGSWSGWKPPFRAHVGRRLRDPGLDVRDIIGAAARRNTARSTRQQQQPAAGAAAGMPAVQEPLPPQAAQPPPLQHQQYEQPAQPPMQQQQQHAAAPQREAVQPQRQEQAAAGKASSASSRGYATSIAGMISGHKPAEDMRTVVGKPSHVDASVRHSTQVAAAESRRQAAAEAAAVVSSLQPTRAAAEGLWQACRKFDREGCGKLSAGEFRSALASARLDSQLSPAAEAALLRGLQDNAGFVPYHHVSAELYRKASAAPAAAGGRPRASSAAPRAAAGRPVSAAQARNVTWGADVPPSPAQQVHAQAARPPGLGRDEPAATSQQYAYAGSGRHTAQMRVDDAAGPHPSQRPATAWAPPQQFADEPHHEQQYRYPYEPPQQHQPWSPYAPPAAEAHELRPGRAPAPQAPPPHLLPYDFVGDRSGVPEEPPVRAGGPAPGEVGFQDRGPDGTYVPFKASPYWFTGNESPEVLQQEAQAYQPRADPARSSLLRRPGQWVGDGGEMDPRYAAMSAAVAAAAAATTGPSTPRTAGAASLPATGNNSPLGGSGGGSGTVSRPVSARGGIVVPPRRPYSAASAGSRSSVGSLLQHTLSANASMSAAAALETLISAQGNGASIGATLKGAAAAAYASSRPAAGVRSRPVSAQPRLGSSGGGQQGVGRSSSFTASAGGRAGPGAVRLEQQLLRDEIKAVRMLY